MVFVQSREHSVGFGGLATLGSLGSSGTTIHHIMLGFGTDTACKNTIQSLRLVVGTFTRGSFQTLAKGTSGEALLLWSGTGTNSKRIFSSFVPILPWRCLNSSDSSPGWTEDTAPQRCNQFWNSWRDPGRSTEVWEPGEHSMAACYLVCQLYEKHRDS